MADLSTENKLTQEDLLRLQMLGERRGRLAAEAERLRAEIATCNAEILGLQGSIKERYAIPDGSTVDGKTGEIRRVHPGKPIPNAKKGRAR